MEGRAGEGGETKDRGRRDIRGPWQIAPVKNIRAFSLMGSSG